MKIRIASPGTELEVTLEDTAAARDFASLLPLELEIEDHASTEKIAYLPRRLSLEGAPAGITPRAGDVCYYAPWGNIALFYRAFDYSPGLVKLGALDDGPERMARLGHGAALFERVPSSTA